MRNLNKLKFDEYSRSVYFKETKSALPYFRDIIKFTNGLGYNAISDGYIVLHRKHSPSGLEDEMPEDSYIK